MWGWECRHIIKGPLTICMKQDKKSLCGQGDIWIGTVDVQIRKYTVRGCYWVLHSAQRFSIITHAVDKTNKCCNVSEIHTKILGDNPGAHCNLFYYVQQLSQYFSWFSYTNNRRHKNIMRWRSKKWFNPKGFRKTSQKRKNKPITFKFEIVIRHFWLFHVLIWGTWA